MLYFEKKREIILLRSLTLVSENTPKVISIGPLITEKRLFKKLSFLSILARFISKIKKTYIFNFLSVKYFGKHFWLRKIWNVRVNYCRNYGPSTLLFCLTEHNLEQLNNRQTEKAVNSLIHYFKSYYQKECLVEVSRFLTQWP